MRLYLGSVIINRLPFGRQSGEICLRYAQTYRLVDNNARDVKVARARILRQIFAYHQAKIQRQSLLFIDHQLSFNQRRQLFANFVKLFVLQIRWKFPGDLFIMKRHLFIAHIKQTIGIRMGKRPGASK